MVSNNSSGPHGLGYGSILRYLDHVDIIYSNGEEGFAENGICDSRLKKILSPLISIHDKLTSFYPDVSKNSCGYRLDSLFTPEFKPQNIFAASEGTLSIIDSLRFKILDLPIFRSLFLVYFSDVLSACLYIKKILSTVPVAVELLDHTVMDSSIKLNTLKENGCLLFVEYFYQFQDKISNIHDLLKRNIYPDGKIVEHAHDVVSINNLWHSRKNALNMAIKNTLGDRRQFTIIEDAAVSIDHLYEYVIYLLSLYNKYDLQYVIYGHAGNGNLHTRPILDSRNNFDDRLHSKHASILKNITYKAFKKIFEYRGTITAEHGDGISRTPFIKNVYNNFVYSYFSYLKKSFDPLNLLNPGKKIP
jgi:FAD/FMN-containing dehydrogenase